MVINKMFSRRGGEKHAGGRCGLAGRARPTEASRRLALTAAWPWALGTRGRLTPWAHPSPGNKTPLSHASLKVSGTAQGP